MQLVLVLNSGSSSLKYELLDMAGPTSVATGLVERIGEDVARLTHRAGDAEQVVERPMADHRAAFTAMAQAFDATVPIPESELVAVGHRVVHGGDRFAAPAVIDPDVIEAIEACVPLAPLHNPANLLGIEVAMQAYPDVPHVAVFDTAFHQTMPESSWRYALERRTADELQIRRYGFHGTSHAYVSRAAVAFLGLDPQTARVITLHLGNGASACAVRGGRSVDTSMGLTPLAGLVMGTRTGDIDPGVLLHLLRGGMGVDELDALLNKRSGMKGLAGENDLRLVHAAQDAASDVALDVYVHAIRHYLGAYLVELGGADAIVFTAGVGENDAIVRAAVCEGLSGLGIALDASRNEAARGPSQPCDISAADAAVRVLVVPTDEEQEIAREALRAIG